MKGGEYPSFVPVIFVPTRVERRLAKRCVIEKEDEEQEALNLLKNAGSYRPTRLRAFIALPRTFIQIAEDYFDEKPRRLLVAGSLAILIGFFSATSAATIIGSVADWDPLAAAVLLFWTENFTRRYYKTKDKTIPLRLLNAFKIGLIYGMAVEAMKLST